MAMRVMKVKFLGRINAAGDHRRRRMILPTKHPDDHAQEMTGLHGAQLQSETSDLLRAQLLVTAHPRVRIRMMDVAGVPSMTMNLAVREDGMITMTRAHRGVVMITTTIVTRHAEGEVITMIMMKNHNAEGVIDPWNMVLLPFRLGGLQMRAETAQAGAEMITMITLMLMKTTGVVGRGAMKIARARAGQNRMMTVTTTRMIEIPAGVAEEIGIRGEGTRMTMTTTTGTTGVTRIGETGDARRGRLKLEDMTLGRWLTRARSTIRPSLLLSHLW